MKSLNLFTFRLLLLGMVLAIASIAFTGCQQGGTREQQQNIAAACSGITVAVNAIAAATEAGQVSKADARKALDIARPTKLFCEPKPADHLTPADYAALLNAAADLATKKEAIP